MAKSDGLMVRPLSGKQRKGKDMKKLLLLLYAAVLLAGSAGADVVDNVVVGNTRFGLSELDPSLGGLGRLTLNSTTLALGTPDGNFVTVDASQNLNIWNGSSRAWMNGVATTAGACSMAVDRNTGRIAVGMTNGTVKLYDSSLTEIGSQIGFGGAIKDIAFQADGDIVFCTSTNAWLMNSALDTILQSQTGFSSITSLAVQSGDRILIGDSVISGGKVYQMSSNFYTVLNSDGGYGAISDIAVQSDDSFVIAAAGKLYRRSVDFVSNGSQAGFSNLTSLAVQSDDQVVAGDNGTGTVYLFTYNLSDFAAPSQGGFIGINNVGVLYMVPEPATLCVLACGALFGLRRRKA